jgi:hypothetical protein
MSERFLELAQLDCEVDLAMRRFGKLKEPVSTETNPSDSFAWYTNLEQIVEQMI